MIYDRMPFLALLPNLINQIEEIHSEETFDQIVEHFKKYLANNPFDTEIWLKFALLFFEFPHDDDEAINCLNKILLYDPNNISAVMLLAYIENYSHWNYDLNLFKKINALKSYDKEILSIIEYEKSWYYYDKDEDLYKQFLINSIELCDKFVLNYKALTRYYISHNAYWEAKQCITKALKNVQHVYNEQDDLDPLDLNEYFNEGLKGIHLSWVNYDILLDLYNSL